MYLFVTLKPFIESHLLKNMYTVKLRPFAIFLITNYSGPLEAGILGVPRHTQYFASCLIGDPF